MPEFTIQEVKNKETGETVSIRVPKGASEEEIFRAADQAFGTPKPEPPAQPPAPDSAPEFDPVDAGLVMLDSMGLGIPSKISGAIEGMFGEEDAPSIESMRAEYPGMKALGVMGSTLLAGPFANAARARFLPQLGAAGRYLANIGTGAAESVIADAMLNGRLTPADVGVSAGSGAALSAVLPPALAMMGRGFSSMSPSSRATRYMARGISDPSEATMEGLLQRMEGAQSIPASKPDLYAKELTMGPPANIPPMRGKSARQGIPALDTLLEQVERNVKPGVGGMVDTSTDERVTDIARALRATFVPRARASRGVKIVEGGEVLSATPPGRPKDYWYLGPEQRKMMDEALGADVVANPRAGARESLKNVRVQLKSGKSLPGAVRASLVKREAAGVEGELQRLLMRSDDLASQPEKWEAAKRLLEKLRKQAGRRAFTDPRLLAPGVGAHVYLSGNRE